MSFSTPVTTATKRAAITRLVKPESLREPGAWPREMKLLNDLIVIYPSDSFWACSELGFTLNSLAYFRTPEGSETVSNLWTVFHWTYPEIDTQTLPSDTEQGATPPPSEASTPRRPITIAGFLSSP